MLLFSSQAQQKPPCPSDFFDFGPQGLDTSNYASVYVTLNHEKIENNYWYGLFVNDNYYAKLNHNEKYIIKIYKAGSYKLKTLNVSIDITLNTKQSYF
jgi:hypothetical protein